MITATAGRVRTVEERRRLALGRPLTANDRETLRWLIAGFSTTEIMRASKLRSVHTAKSRVKALYSKLGAESAAHAAFLAVQQGWVDPVTGVVFDKAVPPVSAAGVRQAVIEIYADVAEKFAHDRPRLEREARAAVLHYLDSRERNRG